MAICKLTTNCSKTGAHWFWKKKSLLILIILSFLVSGWVQSICSLQWMINVWLMQPLCLLHKQEDVLIELSTTWPLLPFFYQLTSLTTLLMQSIAENRFVLWNTRFKKTLFSFVKKNRVIEATYCVCHPPTYIWAELCSIVNIFTFLKSCHQLDIGIGRCVKNIFNIMEILSQWASLWISEETDFFLPLNSLHVAW